MAKTQNKHKNKPKSLNCFCFSGCFGFSDKMISPDDKHVRTKIGKKSSWSKLFRFKKIVIADSKTVPLNATEKTESPRKLFPTSKSSKSRRQSSVNRLMTTDFSTNHEITTPQETVIEVAEDNILLKSGKKLSASSKDNTRLSRLSFRRKIDEIRTKSTSQPGSPNVKPKPNPKPSSLASSVSLPVIKETKTMAKRTRVTSNTISVEKLDPIVGLSVITVTLLIMLLWGRVCAIICTCAWCYFVPILKSRNDLSLGQPELGSKEYNRKVVLEGFLERTHR